VSAEQQGAEVTLRLDPQQLATLVELFAPPPEPQAPAAAETPYDLGLEPFTLYSATHGCDVVAYIDPQKQMRHVPTSRGTDVPKTWRRVWVEVPR
jgi:hypothetical protein